MELIGVLILLGSINGFYRLGFNAGLAWFVITVLLLVVFFPLGILVAAFIAVTGLISFPWRGSRQALARK